MDVRFDESIHAPSAWTRFARRGACQCEQALLFSDNVVAPTDRSGKSMKEGTITLEGRIRILAGDQVTVEVSPYDLTRGRITFRHK